MMKKIKTSIAIVGLSVLSACGGGGKASGDSRVSASDSQIVAGYAMDGYLQRATAFLDLNNNGQLDSGEPSAATDSDGKFSFTATSADLVKAPVVVMAVAGITIDNDTNATVDLSYSMTSPIGKNNVISPITTLIAAKISAGMGADQALAAVKEDLGYGANDSIDLYKDYISEKKTDDNYKKLHNLAAATAVALKAAELSADPTAGLSGKLAAAAKAFTTSVSGRIAEIKAAADTNAAVSVANKLDVKGTAATGAPLADGIVQIYGADGTALLVTPAKIGADGSYKATIPDNAKFPLIFVADDGSQKLISLMASSKDTAVVNITQLTNLIAARISPTGNPGNLLSEIGSGTTITSALVQKHSLDVLTAIKPLLVAHGLDLSSSPISTVFAADGKGYDKMLDTLDIKIEPKGTESTIELTVKQAVREDADLPKVTFSSSAVSSPSLPPLNSGNLPPNGLAPGLNDLLLRANACYALPLLTRISINGSKATDIIATDCKDLFLGNRPQDFLDSGNKVKNTGSFSGIFNTSTPVTFSSPRYNFTVAQDVTGGSKAGDVGFEFRWKDDDNNFQYEKTIVRKDSDGKYRFIGNQYAYPGGISSHAQRRNFLVQPASTFNSVGYTFDVPCNEKTISWKKVNITAPNGKKITLVPRISGTPNACDYGNFVIAKNIAKDSAGDNSTPSLSWFYRLSSIYEAPNEPENAKHPRDRELQLVFAPEDWSDSQIEQIPHLGVWKYEYFTNDVTTPTATQYFRTTSRVMTVAGFRYLKGFLPRLTANYEIKCYSGVCFTIPNAGPFPVSWTMQTPNPLATFRARVYGTYGPLSSRTSFEDTRKFPSSALSIGIICGNGVGVNSPQCQGGVYGNNYATVPDVTIIDAVQLVSRVAGGAEVDHMHALYKLPLP